MVCEHVGGLGAGSGEGKSSSCRDCAADTAKATLVAQVEGIPAPLRKKPLHGPSALYSIGLSPAGSAGYNEETTLQLSSYRNPTATYKSSEGRQSFPRQGLNPGNLMSRQTFVEQAPNQRGSRINPPPVTRQVTARHPPELTSRVNDLAIGTMSPIILASGNDPYVSKFKDIFTNLERFAKKWTLASPKQRMNTLVGRPASISKE